MAAELFVDTSAWRPNLVVAETHALLVRRISHCAAIASLTDVVVPPTIVVISTKALEERARIDFLIRYRDQPFSFTDTVSFAVMRERNIVDALTLDPLFATAGDVMVPATAEV